VSPSRRTAALPEDQALLVDACLREDEAAVAAWRALEPRFDLDTLPDGLFFLMPTLSSRSEELGIGGGLQGRLAGIRRRTWVMNELVLADVEKLLQRFDAGGVRSLALATVPMLTVWYETIDLRPTARIDVVVPPESLEDATAILAESSGSPAPAVPDPRAVRWFRRDERSSYALTSALEEPYCAPAGDGLWTGATSAAVRDATTLVPAASDELLHLLMHGARPSEWPRIQWIADAATVLRSRPAEVDWGYVVEQAQKRGLSTRLRKALDVLRRPLGGLVPGEDELGLRAAGARDRVADSNE
jgi:hypothetical protein